MAMVYLLFNEGYSAGAGTRNELCDEAIRLARLLLRLFQTEPEIMGLIGPDAVAACTAAGTLRCRHERNHPAGRPGSHAAGMPSADCQEALALIDKAMRHNSPGPYQIQAAIAASHARAAVRAAGYRLVRDRELSMRVLEQMQPSPVITLNRAVATWPSCVGPPRHWR